MRFGSMQLWEILRGVYYFFIEDFIKVIDGFDKFYEIGEGGFGKVFVGNFVDGCMFVIKWVGLI